MQIDHPLYPPSTLEAADGVAWVATSKESPLVMYPFTFFPLEPSEVRLKILYTSLCHSDIMTIREQWGPCNYPICPGHEVVGQITLVGENVNSLKIGDLVGVSPVRYSDLTCGNCKKEKTNLCDQRIYLYGQYFGGYCTHLQIDHNWAIPIPKGLDLLSTPPLLCAGITVYAPLKRYAKVGATCAVIGIGGLGHLGIQYANKLGMKVTAFTTKTNNLSSLQELGADNAEHSTNAEELRKNEGKYDIVLSTLFISDCEIYKLHQRLTKKGGVHIMVGVPQNHVKYEIDSDYIIKNEIKLVGSNVGSIKEVKEMLEFSALYNVRSQNEYYEFQDFNLALERAEKANPRYRVVVNVANWAKKNNFDK